jgi:hypothetical protein
MGALTASVHALRRPVAITVTSVAMVLAAAVATVATFTTATATGGGDGRAPVTSSVADLASADGLAAGIRSATTLVGAIAFVFVAAVVATEHSTGAIRNVVMRNPRRVRLYVCRVGCAGAVAAGTALVAGLVSIGVAWLVAPANDVATRAWSTGSGISAALGALANLAVGALGFGLLGGAAGALTRSAPVAIGGGVAWLLAGETILTGLEGSIERLLPGRHLAALATGGTAQIPYLAAVVAAGAICTAATATAAAVFQHRDLTS